MQLRSIKKDKMDKRQTENKYQNAMKQKRKNSLFISKTE